jgi:hypothetical protein
MCEAAAAVRAGRGDVRLWAGRFSDCGPLCCAVLQDGFTAVMGAAARGDTVLVTELVRLGASLNTRDKARAVACFAAVC